jgi:dTMP kinase
MASGRFITFEGGEGSGKSTQAKLLADRLSAQGVDVVLTREPGGSPFAENVRTLILDPEVAPHSALSEALLFYSARADHLDKTIRPALTTGRWVICDRFSDSTRVYQCEAGGLSLEVFNWLEQHVVKLTYPDLTFLLDVPVDVGLGRATTRRLARALAGEQPDAYEKRDLDFHERLRAGYLAIAKADARRCIVLDAAKQAEPIASEIWGHIVRRMLVGTR